jgi:hypothetical protein
VGCNVMKYSSGQVQQCWPRVQAAGTQSAKRSGQGVVNRTSQAPQPLDACVPLVDPVNFVEQHLVLSLHLVLPLCTTTRTSQRTTANDGAFKLNK